MDPNLSSLPSFARSWSERRVSQERARGERIPSVEQMILVSDQSWRVLANRCVDHVSLAATLVLWLAPVLAVSPVPGRPCLVAIGIVIMAVAVYRARKAWREWRS